MIVHKINKDLNYLFADHHPNVLIIPKILLKEIW